MLSGKLFNIVKVYNKMKITLIGASGFVGSRLIELLKPTLYSLQNIDKQQSLFYPEITSIANVLDKKDN